MKEIVRKLYVNGWIRIPVKFVFSWVALKVVWDYYQYRTAWRNLGPNPRCLSFFDQCPLQPYIPTPYPHYTNYQQFLDTKRWFAVHNQKLKIIAERSDRYFIYNNAPCRQSINQIDRFFLRAKEHVNSEVGKFYFLGQLAKREGGVPQGVYQQIRKTRQEEVEVQGPLVPKL